VVAIDSFVPPTNLPAEAARPPRPAHGQRRNNAPRTAGNRNQPPREGLARDGRSQKQKPRNPQQREQPPRNNPQQREQQPRNGQQSAKPRAPQKTADQQHLSEAARHQAMPQPALFSPKPGVRRGR
jgi:ATP-dependent RNA helicase RhlE